MKAFKIGILLLSVVFVSSYFVTSCSKENETNQKVDENAKVSAYLKSFYSTNYELGKSVETKTSIASNALSRTTEVDNIIITEVFVGDNPIARGYVITDKTSNDFLYFIDVNRIDYKLTSVKVDVNETKVFEDINQLDKYISTNHLDYIKIAEDYNSSQSTDRRFWGWQNWVDCDKATGQGTLMHTYYVFGIGVQTAPVTGSNGENIIEPCAGGALSD